MKYWFRGKRGGVVAFLLIAALVAGGLGWVTGAALRLEQEQLQAHAGADLQRQLQLALSLLDSRIRPVLAKEDGRPYNHYVSVYAPSLTLLNDGQALPPGSVLEPSPLLTAELPDWMLLHFQADEKSGWGSPQLPERKIRLALAQTKLRDCLVNVTAAREELRGELSRALAPHELLVAVQHWGAEPSLKDIILMPAPQLRDNPGTEPSANAEPFSQAAMPPQEMQKKLDPAYVRRAEQGNAVTREGKANNFKDDRDVALGNIAQNDENWLNRVRQTPARGEQVEVNLSPMVALWLQTKDQQDRLLVARVVRIADRQVCQGIVLDWPRLQQVLASEVKDTFPNARFVPVTEWGVPPERTLSMMTALPVQLDPNVPPLALSDPGWTPLRVGLCLAWAAALVALLAVGLGGWSLLDLSERRIQFVSAVTHELRTPLTTLRLYLDMLTGGLVREEKQREEYLQTLHAESERLSRLVGNVLDFSRLENQQPRLIKGHVAVDGLLEQLRATWQGRCHDAGKELVVENVLGADAELHTDVELVQQVLGNLIDNACKYSRGAADGHIWVRACQPGKGQVVLEVEDRGPGVPRRERQLIFRPFRRGRGSEVTAGGVGLGLALAQRWAHLLGGRLTLRNGPEGTGACFRLELR